MASVAPCTDEAAVGRKPGKRQRTDATGVQGCIEGDPDGGLDFLDLNDPETQKAFNPKGPLALLELLQADYENQNLTRMVFDVAFLDLVRVTKSSSSATNCNNWNIFPKERMDRIRRSMLGDNSVFLEDKDKAYIRLLIKKGCKCIDESGKLAVKNKKGKDLVLLDETEVFDALYGVYVRMLETRKDEDAASLKAPTIAREARESYSNITDAVVHRFVHACVFLCINHGLALPPGSGKTPAGWQELRKKRKSQGSAFQQNDLVGGLLKYGLNN